MIEARPPRIGWLITGALPESSPTGGAQLLDYTGRVAIDPVKHEMRLLGAQTDLPVDPATTAAIGAQRVRRYAIDQGQLTITFLDEKQATTAVAVFRRAATP